MSKYRDLLELAAGVKSPRKTCYNCIFGELCEGTRTSAGLPWVKCTDTTGRAYVKVSGGIRSGSNTIKAKGFCIDPHARNYAEECQAFKWEPEIAPGVK
jgi:hypothetical protein